MAAARHMIRSEDVHGLKYFEALRGLIERLHVVGTERDRSAGSLQHAAKTCVTPGQVENLPPRGREGRGGRGRGF